MVERFFTRNRPNHLNFSVEMKKNRSDLYFLQEQVNLRICGSKSPNRKSFKDSKILKKDPKTIKIIRKISWDDLGHFFRVTLFSFDKHNFIRTSRLKFLSFVIFCSGWTFGLWTTIYSSNIEKLNLKNWLQYLDPDPLFIMAQNNFQKFIEWDIRWTLVGWRYLRVWRKGVGKIFASF